MKNFAQNAFAFFKKETVLCIAFVLAVISFIPAVFASGAGAFLSCTGGIDFHVLGLLFCLMSVVAGWQKLLVFRRCGNFLIGKLKHTRAIYLLLIYFCFFTSMILTNDVALITFVPFSVMLLPMIGQKKRLIFIVVMQTIAANLGSMLTPLGNPQNLYLYATSSMTLPAFMGYLFPAWMVSLVLITLPFFFLKNEPISAPDETALPPREPGKELVFTILFVLCLLCVLDVLPYQALFVITLITLLAADKSILGQVDYFLLITFVCFFIFVYNIKLIPEISSFLSGVLEGNEFRVGLLCSQFISNVPATLLLAGFTENYAPLLLGVNIGGLGTLIASLASLISFKLYLASNDSKGGKYFATFTLWNLLYLIVLCILCHFMYAL